MEEYMEIIKFIYKDVDENVLKYGIQFAELVLTIIAIIIGIIILISMFKIFKKAGQNPWKSLIPIYNYVILYKISGMSPLFLLTLILFLIPKIGLISFIIWNIVDATQKSLLAKKFNKSIFCIQKARILIKIFVNLSIKYCLIVFNHCTY